ncbi:MAG: hypothetical protein ACOVQ0_05330 [Novosphingobium sp.]|uniref:hypothetical protein n=1 Tax=Novosphingobium sp. TaxID=1874826 RepID=UPI003B9A9C23
MKQTIVVAALLLSTPLTAQTGHEPFGQDPSDPVSSFAIRDKAGNEQQHMVSPAPAPGRIEGERCLPKTRLCFSISEVDNEAWPQLRVREFGGGSDRSLPIDLIVGADQKLAIWSLGIRRAGQEVSRSAGEAVIIGVEAWDHVAYSGGTASKATLWLYQIDNAGTTEAVARQVLSVPLNGEQYVRACFNAKDEKARANACMNLTSIDAMLVLDAENAEPMPAMIYRVATGSYPSDIPFRKVEDQPKKLTNEDLIPAQHPTCSYERKLAWNPATVRFEFDRPAPDCQIFGLHR